MAITQIKASNIEDGTVVAAEIADDAIITAKINADAVDGTKIADNAINSEHLAADSVDGTKIVDDAINSEHYAAGSVDNAHLATGIDAGKLINALPVISGASLTNLPAGGDTRNFIIDGDFTQWPTGTAFPNIAHVTYGHALSQHVGVAGLFAINRSTSVPTVAQSSHQSTYSQEVDCTTADASPGSSDYQEIRYYVTGSDFAFLHKQTVTLAFWWYSTLTGTCSGSIRNSASNRSYPYSFTVSASNTWEYKTITIALDTSGTWLFTEADVGCTITFNLLCGSGLTQTANTWYAGDSRGATGTANHASSTSNIVRISQVGLYLGATAPTFLGEPISTVRSQVEYYVRRVGDVDSGYLRHGIGHANTASSVRTAVYLQNPMRATFTGSFVGTIGNWATHRVNATVYNGTFTQGGRISYLWTTTVASTPFALDHSYQQYINNTGNTDYILLDARH